MRIDLKRNLFVGIRIDAKLREQLQNCAAKDKQFIDGSKSEYLLQVRALDDIYIGKTVTAGTSSASFDDIKRNIVSILTRIAPGRYGDQAIIVYALDEDPELIG